MKNHPLESSLEFLDSLNYENTIEHSLIWAHKCNVPDLPTGEEDATNTKLMGKQPHEHEQG